MAISSQQTELYVNNSTVTKIGCPTSISGGGFTNEQVETTCLDATTRSYISGLSTPQTVSFDVNFDPSDSSHAELNTLHDSGDKVPWCIAFSDGDSEPTYSDPDWSATGRSIIGFEAFISELSYSFDQNSPVTASVTLQVSGRPKFTAAS